jgi:hypothetical protein
MECKDEHERVLRSGYFTVEIVIPAMNEEKLEKKRQYSTKGL